MNLDRDVAPERLVTVAVRLPYFPTPIAGRVWAVRDIVAGRRVTVRLGPPGERLNAPRRADRNGDGLPDLFLEAQAGNSLFFGEIWQWNGRRARRLWRDTPGILNRVVGPAETFGGPIATRFPDADGDGISDVVSEYMIAECRACEGRRVGLRYTWRPVLRRWAFALIEDL